MNNIYVSPWEYRLNSFLSNYISPQLGMGSATETLCGQAFGAKLYDMMGIYLQRSWIVLSFTATLLLPWFILATPILGLLGQEEELSTASGPIALWFIPIIYSYVFYITMQMYLQAQLKNVIIAWLACGSFVLHVLASWISVVKLNWGLAGAMGSMVLSSWLPIFGEFVYVFCGWCPETWRGFSLSAFSDLLQTIKLSISSGIMLWLACPSLCPFDQHGSFRSSRPRLVRWNGIMQEWNEIRNGMEWNEEWNGISISIPLFGKFMKKNLI